MAKIKIDPDSEFKEELVNQMLKLATSGFGLVAALAWNELIKTTVNEYIKPFFGRGSGLVSQFIYAIMVTILAVSITYNLTKLSKKVENKKKAKKKN